MVEHGSQLIDIDQFLGKPFADVLRSYGAIGLMLLEFSLSEILDISHGRSYKTGGIKQKDAPWKTFGIYWAYPRNDKESCVTFYTKNVHGGKSVYICDDEIERFKELFLEERWDENN